MKIFLIPFSIFIMLLQSSCCTKEQCLKIQSFPKAYVQFSNFDYYDLENSKMYVFDILNSSIIDSFDLNISTNETIDIFKTGNIFSVNDLKNFSFVFVTNITSDTIYDIDYDEHKYKIKCHTCFLANGKEEIEEIQNFTFYHQNIQYAHNDTIIINK